ncbi:MAG: Zn-dependent hydrolase [Sphingomonas bacterium]|nr:Zn-dependent hydrolase [Sphingomonas bacterium]
MVTAAGGARAVARCDLLGVAPYSDMEGGLYRGYLTPAYAEAQRAVGGWMIEAGMAVHIDPAGNLIGRYEGLADGPALLIGSHLDSVRDGGRYDGPLGIMLGIECIAALHAGGRRMPFPIDIYAFGDEEGSRFPAAMLTSRAVAGTLDRAALAMADGDGVTLEDALATASLDVARYTEARHGPALAYLEAHIEQGPVLEAESLAAGTVTGIAAQLRYAITVTGRAGHAGTNSMTLRRDALAAAAAMVLAAEEVALRGPNDLVATVGRLEVSPGAANVVPGRVMFTLDIRAGNGDARDSAASSILEHCRRIAAERDVGIAIEPLQNLPASPCDPALMEMLDAAIAEQGIAPRRLVSGAGHDAMMMAALCPTAMLFLRCKGGISHNPAESVDPKDAEIALRVMLGFIDRLGERVRG